MGLPYVLALACLALARSAEPRPGAESAGPEGAVARELRVRRWALGPEPAAGALATALASASWQERLDALDALARAARAGGTPDATAATRLLDDPHPNVRAGALRLMAEVAPERACDAALQAAGARLPLERLGAVAVLAESACDAGRLAALALDPDPRVAAAARAAACARADESALVRALARSAASDDVEALRDAEWLVTRAPLHAAAVAELRQLADGLRPPARARAFAAAVEAGSFAALGRGDAERLLAGWLATPERDPRRQAALTDAARSGDVELGRALLMALDELTTVVSGASVEAPRFGALVADAERLRAVDAAGEQLFHAPRELAETALETLGVDAALRLAAELALGPRALVELCPALALRARTLPLAPCASWLAPGAAPELRAAALRAFASIAARGGERTAGPLLVLALDDPDPELCADAFRALCQAHDVAPFVPALHAAWERQPAGERRRRLDWLPRGAPLFAFRPALLALGEEGGDARRLAAELLSGARGDEAVAARLAAWLADELAGLAREGAGTPAFRPREQRVQGAVRALAAVDPERGVPAFERALHASTGASTEIGKSAAAALGLTATGRARLAELLGTALDRRTRIEVAIALASRTDGRPAGDAVSVLVADYPAAARDLRERMLVALGAAGTAEARLSLQRIVEDGARGALERGSALEAVVGAPEAAELCARIAVADVPLELRRLAVRLLGAPLGDAARLERLHDALARPPADGARRSAAEEERALLAAELLVALGRTGRLPERLHGAWLAAATRAAPEVLAGRLRGEELPAVDFAWRAELELAGVLAEAGALEDALAGADLALLDGRLALALAGRVAPFAGAEASALRLLRAGQVALLGEPEPDSGLLGRARALQLALAWRGARWGEAERAAVRLESDYRRGASAASAWADVFGVFERERGVDPLGRVASAARQARAWRALERGEVAVARAAAAEARALVGSSRAARAEQERLEAAVAARE